jgi:Zn-finger nucleic acid-binding protein
MVGVEVGTTVVRECRTCFGLWVDLQSFEEICSDREQQSAVLGAARFEPEQGSISRADALRVRYVPCPECAQLMNRVNFAKCSGVVIDVCKGHGTWFDARELQQIVEFIHTGGLEASRQREKRTLEEEWRKLRLEQMSARTSGDQLVGGDITIGSHSSAVLAASELMKLFS